MFLGLFVQEKQHITQTMLLVVVFELVGFHMSGLLLLGGHCPFRYIVGNDNLYVKCGVGINVGCFGLVQAQTILLVVVFEFVGFHMSGLLFLGGHCLFRSIVGSDGLYVKCGVGINVGCFGLVQAV